jgi:hypothetical protein
MLRNQPAGGKSPQSSAKGGAGIEGEITTAIGNSEDLKVRHSVLKGLWFPILTNLTNLIMERRRDLQEKGSSLFFKILNHYTSDFDIEFWREILNQIVLPLLEDINLAVEIPNKK